MADVLIPRTSGTVFGNLNQLAGLSALFDGVETSNNPNFGAYHAGASAYAGKSFATPVKVSKAAVIGWNDRGLLDDASSGTAFLYASNSLPAHETDGVMIGQTAFVEPSGVAYGAAVEIVSTDPVSEFLHVWVRVSGGVAGVSVAEIRLYSPDGVAIPPPPPPQIEGRPLAIFLGSGQSNMKGDAPIPDQSVYVNRARVKMFALDGQIKPAADPMMNAAGSLWPQYANATIGCGSLLSFGDAIVATLKNFDVLLVNSSKGSTSIEQWANGQPLYDGLIARANAALAAAPYGSFIAGFVWQQGESNTFTEALAAGWVPQFKQLIANVRADLGLPELPVAFIGLGPADSFAPGWPMLRFAQQFMALPSNTAYVKTFDLENPQVADWIVTASVLEVGKRAAASMKTLLPAFI